MKTSNKLLLAIGLIILACLVGYNFALEKEYDKGDFRSPFYGMHQINVSNFKVIEHRAANIFGIKVQYGPNYGVWVKLDFKHKLTFTKKGNTLAINYIGDGNERHSYDDAVILVCPVVDSVVTSAFLNTKTSEGIDRYNAYLTTEIIGFKQQIMSVIATKYTRIALDRDTLSHLSTLVGDTKTSSAELEISNNNKIAHADFKVFGKNTLRLTGNTIGSCSNDISDSASVMLNNSPLKLFTRP